MNLMLFRVEFSQLGAHSEAVCSILYFKIGSIPSILYFKIGSIPHTAPEPGLSWKNSTRPIDHSFLYEWPIPVETIRDQNISLSRKFVPYSLFCDIKNSICSHLIRPPPLIYEGSAGLFDDGVSFPRFRAKVPADSSWLVPCLGLKMPVSE